MFWSKLFIPTLREAPAGVDGRGAQLLTRAGFLRGTQFLYLGHRAMAKLTATARAELNAAGGQEMSPSSTASSSLAATARGGELRSYKQLPQLWYQSGNTVEICALGLPGHDVTAIAGRIAQRGGLPVTQAGDYWVLLSNEGALRVAYCEEANYCEPLESAHTIPQPPPMADPEGDLEPERFHTPGQKTIANLSEFTGLPPAMQMKSLVLTGDGGKPVLVLVRGDHQLEPAKLSRAMGWSKLPAPATSAEIFGWFGAAPGSLGPVGLKTMPIVADLALQGRRNMICGANEDDYHLRHVTPGEDFAVQFHDLRQAEEGDMCPAFPAAVVIRTAHALGVVRSADPGPVAVLNESGVTFGPPFVTGEVDLRRMLFAMAELYADGDGLSWPREVAPFDVVITAANFSDAAQRAAALSLYEECARLGLDALLDDRDERPGVKFKDADLIGVPARLTIGKKLGQGLVEMVERKTKQMRDVPVESAAGAVRTLLGIGDAG